MGVFKPHLKPLALNALQYATFLIIWWQSYLLVDIIVSRKLHVTIHRLKKRKVLSRVNLPGISLTIYKIIFISLVSEKYKIWVSKISVNSKMEDNKSFICYHARSNRIRVVDGYIILYRTLIIAAGLVVIHYLLPYLHTILTDDFA